MIVTDLEACTGCRMCELVCSFHHKGAFSPELSSIRISRNDRSGEIGITIDPTCDFCQGEEQLLCVKSCCFGALREVK